MKNLKFSLCFCAAVLHFSSSAATAAAVASPAAEPAIQSDKSSSKNLLPKGRQLFSGDMDYSYPQQQFQQQQQVARVATPMLPQSVPQPLPYVPYPGVPYQTKDYSLKTAGHFSITDSGLVYWGLVGLVGVVLALGIIMLITGASLNKVVGATLAKGRALDFGFDLKQEDLNRMTQTVMHAIDTYRKFISKQAKQ